MDLHIKKKRKKKESESYSCMSDKVCSGQSNVPKNKSVIKQYMARSQCIERDRMENILTTIECWKQSVKWT